MRFIRKELSPANKVQYLLALGRRDIELLLGEAVNAARHTPTTRDQKDDKRRLTSIASELGKALELAKQDGDDGERLPIEERQAYKNERDKNPMLNVTRLEIIDHRPCEECDSVGYIPETEHNGRAFKACPRCLGLGSKGRNHIFTDPNVEVTSSIQDEGKTLKLFLNQREELKPTPKTGHIPREFKLDEGAVKDFMELLDAIGYPKK